MLKKIIGLGPGWRATFALFFAAILSFTVPRLNKSGAIKSQ